MRTPQLILASGILSCTLLAKAPDAYEPDWTAKPPVTALSPEEELKTIQLPPGYSLELVLSERDGIREPVNVTFDGNGRMYVAEMRTYMQDINATGQSERAGVVSRHESTKGDGTYDKHTIFADKLLLPREVLPLDDRVLINETDTMDLVMYQDTKGTGVADKKELWFEGGPKGGNMEHQQSGLIWALDNWIYQSTSPIRLRWDSNGKSVQEKIPFGGGQWGLAQDNYGKIWWSNAGGERALWHFQTPILYGAFDAPGQMAADFLEVWPLVALADYQGGPSRVRMPDKTLNHFSAACGQEVVRGDRLPAELRGDVLISEPVGRLIRRAKVEVKDGITTITNPHGKSEFIRSTDPSFRIVNMTNGPDGCLYLVDMYRGVIQEGNWTREGSYLRKVIQQYGMDKITGHGRIWRLVHKDHKPGPQPRLLDKTAAQLVSELEHPNGWWRDTAQKLLVLKNDKSVVPQLEQLALNSPSELGRIHALWTLEGMDSLSANLVRSFLQDPAPQIRIMGIRTAERLILKGQPDLQQTVAALSQNTDATVLLQVLMTGKLLSTANPNLWPEYTKFAQKTLLVSSPGVKSLGTVLLTGEDKVGGREFNEEEIALLEKGQAIYKEVCFACHGFDGKGMPIEGGKPGVTIAPALAASKNVRLHRDAITHVLLHGLTGPVDGKSFDAMMVPMANNDDEWIAAIASYVRNAFGNHGALVTADSVKKIREANKDRKDPWTSETLAAALPSPLKSGDWKITASEGIDPSVLGDGKQETLWKAAIQKVGQWIQIELPEPTSLSGVRLENWRAMGDSPKRWRVEVSSDGKKWQKLGEANGLAGCSEIHFDETRVKFVKATLTGFQKGKSWSIGELQLLGANP